MIKLYNEGSCDISIKKNAEIINSLVLKNSKGNPKYKKIAQEKQK